MNLGRLKGNELKNLWKQDITQPFPLCHRASTAKTNTAGATTCN